jgi:hypothetical protein
MLSTVYASSVNPPTIGRGWVFTQTASRGTNAACMSFVCRMVRVRGWATSVPNRAETANRKREARKATDRFMSNLDICGDAEKKVASR